MLVDSQALIWFVDQHEFLSPAALAAMTNPANRLVLSAATVWEIAIKVSLKKLRFSIDYRAWMDQAVRDIEASILPITIGVAAVQAGLPWHHRDPFDRLVIAHALTESTVVISADSIFEQYGVTRVW